MEMERFIKRPTTKHLEKLFLWCPSYEVDRILWHHNLEYGGVLAVFTGKDAVAYLYYRELSKDVVRIEFIEVNKEYRREGVGRRFMEKALQYFLSERYKAVDVNCVTEEGLYHARKLGFRKYSPVNFSGSSTFFERVDCMLFRSLVPSALLKPYKAKCILSFVVWKVDYNENTNPDLYYDLSSENSLPLVDYLHYDWYVGIMKDGVVYRKEKVKRFFKNWQRWHEFADIVYLTTQDIMNESNK